MNAIIIIDMVPMFVWNMMFDACANSQEDHVMHCNTFLCRKDLQILEKGTSTAANVITMNALVTCAANMREAHGVSM